MKRPARICLEILAPPLLGGLFFVGLILLLKDGQESWEMFFGILLFAYAFGLVPSLVYAVCMEWAFARGLNPRSKGTVALSALLGTLAGTAIGILVELQVMVFAPMGLLVGALLGLIIRAGTKPQPSSKA